MPPATSARSALLKPRRGTGTGIWPTGIAAAAAYFAAGVLLTLIGAEVNGLLPPVWEAPGYSWVLILLLGCAGLLFRRRNVPLMLALTGTAVVASLLTGTGLITYLLAFEVFYSGILFGSPRLSRAVERACLYAAVLLAAGTGVAHQDWSYVLLGVLQALIICIVPLWWAGTLRRQMDLASQERLRADTERLNAERAAEMADLFLKVAVANERAAMARELHDAIAGRLSAVALQSAAALSAENPELDRRVLAQIRIESVQALNEMRAMIDLLEATGRPEQQAPGRAAGPPEPDAAISAAVAPHPAAVPDPAAAAPEPAAGGLEQLETLAASARLAGSPVELEVRTGGGLPALVNSSVYRIVQESLTNAVKHAPGQPVQVLVRHDDGEVLVTVRNSLAAPEAESSTAGSGTLPDPAGNGNGTGLRNIALRAAQLSGTSRSGPVRSDRTKDAAGSGDSWEVQVRLPVEETP